MKKGIVVIMLAMLAMSSFCFIPYRANADTVVQRLWIRVRGIVTQWGEDPVFGWIGAQARMVNENGTHHEWAGAQAIWSYDRPHLNCTEPPTENFTFSFYAARMVNTTDVALNYSGYDMGMSGLWNVIKVTTTINVDENGELVSFTRTFEPVVTEAYGELHVFANWHLFELGIAGIPLLGGDVVGHAIRFVAIKICDINGDDKVDLIDLVRVAKRYGSMPGLRNFDFEMDFNSDNKIDVGDLTTIAANVEG